MRFSRTAISLAAALALSVPGVALAHAELVSAAPAANRVAKGVTRITLRFSERLMPRLSGATVTMTGMAGHASHATALTNLRTVVSNKTLTLTSARPLAVGTYRVDWHAVASDTHREAGSYSFSVG